MTKSQRSAIDITDNPPERRYEARLGGDVAGVVEYGRMGNRLIVFHTEVPPEFEGRGIASALVERVLADARRDGLKITPRCPFFAAHFKRHPEDADLLAPPRDRSSGGREASPDGQS